MHSLCPLLAPIHTIPLLHHGPPSKLLSSIYAVCPPLYPPFTLPLSTPPSICITYPGSYPASPLPSLLSFIYTTRLIHRSPSMLSSNRDYPIITLPSLFTTHCPLAMLPSYHNALPLQYLSSKLPSIWIILPSHYPPSSPPSI